MGRVRCRGSLRGRAEVETLTLALESIRFQSLMVKRMIQCFQLETWYFLLLELCSSATTPWGAEVLTIAGVDGVGRCKLTLSLEST